jgi:hypothetical protein
MSCNNKPETIAHRTSSTPSSPNGPAALWEHVVLHRSSKEEVMLSDLEIEDSKANANSNHSDRKMSALDAATTIVMHERQHSVSAPVTAMADTTDAVETVAADSATETETKLRAALLASLEHSSEPEAQTSSSNATASDINSISPKTSPSHHIAFGPTHLLTLSPEIQHSEAARQESLIKTCSTVSLTIQKRRPLLADAAGAIREEEVVMSGALDWADVRCEVCAARERAMGGLEETGIVAL